MASPVAVELDSAISRPIDERFAPSFFIILNQYSSRESIAERIVSFILANREFKGFAKTLFHNEKKSMW